MSVDDQATVCKRLLDGAGVAFLAVDGDLAVRYCNPRTADLLGLPHDRILGCSIEQVFGPERGEMIARYLRRSMQRSECRDFELQHVDRAGNGRYLAVTCSPAGAQDGAPPGASICLRDITRRIELQEELGRARKMHALKALAGKLAHHFNNILGGVVTSVDFAKQSGDPRLLKKTVHGAAGALQRAATLLEGLLAFAEADHRDADLADLTETVLHFVHRIEPELIDRHIELDLRLSDVPVVAVPMNHFMTVLQNLTDNAIDAMGDGGQLAIELEPNGEQVICRIIDSGGGIVREDLERVFEPFYSTKDGAGSVGAAHPGLGLSVAMGIVHEMRGQISIRSLRSNATEVEIRLPLDPGRPITARWSEQEPISPFPDSEGPETP